MDRTSESMGPGSLLSPAPLPGRPSLAHVTPTVVTARTAHSLLVTPVRQQCTAFASISSPTAESTSYLSAHSLCRHHKEYDGDVGHVYQHLLYDISHDIFAMKQKRPASCPTINYYYSLDISFPSQFLQTASHCHATIPTATDSMPLCGSWLRSDQCSPSL